MRAQLVQMIFCTVLFAGFVVGCEPATTASLPAAGPNAVEMVFQSDPAGAQIIIDGVSIGPAPQTVRLNPGPHRLKASKSGYFAQEQKILVGSAEPTQHQVTLVASH